MAARDGGVSDAPLGPPACTAPSPALLASTTQPYDVVGQVASHGPFVYWTDEHVASPGDLHRVPRDAADGGGDAYLGQCGVFAIDGEIAYCATVGPRIVAIPLAGGGPMTLATVTARDIVAAAGTLYFSSCDGDCETAMTIERLSESGGTPVLLASAPFIRVYAANAGAVYWSSTDGGTYQAPVTAINVTTDDATTTTLATLPACDDLYVVAYDPADATSQAISIWAVPRAGGDVARFATDILAAPIAADDYAVYATSNATNALVALPFAGGPPRAIDMGFAGGPVGVDDSFVYAARNDDLGGGSVHRACK